MDKEYYIYNKINRVILGEYNLMLERNGLENEDELKIESIDDRLNIEDYSESGNVDLETYRETIKSYKNDMEKIEKKLRDNELDRLAKKVSNLKDRLENMEDDEHLWDE